MQIFVDILYVMMLFAGIGLVVIGLKTDGYPVLGRNEAVKKMLERE